MLQQVCQSGKLIRIRTLKSKYEHNLLLHKVIKVIVRLSEEPYKLPIATESAAADRNASSSLTRSTVILFGSVIGLY